MSAERAARLRIAHLTATFPPYPGGAGNTAYRFAKGQAERGHHVEVFTAPAEGEAPDSGEAVVHRIKPVFAIGNAPLIPSLAGIDGFDVVHLHYPFIFGSELTLLGRLARRRRRQALLIHYKNRLVAKGPRQVPFEAYEHTVAPLLVRAADRICVLSPDHAGSVSVPAADRGARSLQAGRDAERSRRRPLRSGPRRCRSESRGGHPTMTPWSPPSSRRSTAPITSSDWTSPSSRSPSSTTSGPTCSSRAAASSSTTSVRQAGRLGIAERVHFLGAVPHSRLPAVLRAADLLLLTTEPPESFGIVLIEAMAAGLPTVATEYPGVRAVVDEGETGLIVPPGDADAVAGAIRRLTDAGPSGREAMGAAGRAKAERLWSWPRLLDRMDAAYAEAIASRRRRTP